MMAFMLLAKRLILVSVLAVTVTAFSKTINNADVEVMVNDPRLVNHEMVSEMLDWLDKTSPYARMPGQTVDIRFANKKFLIEEWKRNGGSRDIDIYALTTVDIHTRKIIVYIPLNFNWESHRDQTHLMHEIVHNQQYMYYKDYNIDCINDMEYEAYMLALTWFMEKNIDDVVFVTDRLKKLDSYADCPG